MTAAIVLEQGRDAYERCEWVDAYARLSAADADSPLEPADLERLETAAYLTGHDEESTTAWARAHQAHLQAGEPERAVRCAFWLGFGLIQRGEMAQGGGWMARARSLVEAAHLRVPPSPWPGRVSGPRCSGCGPGSRSPS